MTDDRSSVVKADMAGPEDPTMLEWARKVHAEGTLIFHTGLGQVHTVKRVWSGEGDDAYVSPYNGQSVTTVVLEFEDGSSAIAEPGKFLEITGAGKLFFEEATRQVATASVYAMRAAYRLQLPPEDAMTILGAVMRSQVERMTAAQLPTLPPAPEEVPK